KYMKISDVFLFPSRREGFGTVQIEAMASGCPVIANYLPGITDEIINDTVNGYIIYSESDIKKYLLIIINLLSDKNLSQQISENAVKKVFMKFSRETVMQNYIKLYQQAM